MTYEAGFAQGEIDAHNDRKAGQNSSMRPQQPQSLYQRGYWDAYTPRTATWWTSTKRTQLETA